MSNIIAPLIVGYVAIAATIFPFAHMNDMTLSVSTSLRYCIFWPAYVIHWIVRNAILAIKGI